MLKSCKYCGKIHDSKTVCDFKPVAVKKDSKANRFRKTNLWKEKSMEIRRRDNFLCQVCLKENIFNYQNLQVHHIISIERNFDKRLDNDNLITLCSKHHKQAENQEIKAEELLKIVKEKGNHEQVRKKWTIEKRDLLW